MTLARFAVRGAPAPQGSKTIVPDRVTGKPIVIEGSSTSGRAKHKAWRGQVRDVAEWYQPRGHPHDGALTLHLVFRVQMPASRPAERRRLGIGPHTVKPDIDKMTRTTLDALTDARLIADDGRISELHVYAVETTGWTGAAILLEQWSAGAQLAPHDHLWLQRHYLDPNPPEQQ